MYKEPKNETPKPHVLKISESMLFVDGDGIDEIGNIMYRELPHMFSYDPNVGLHIHTRSPRNNRELGPNDFIKLNGHYGYVTVKELLGDEPRDFREKEFDMLVMRYSDKFRKPLEKITYIASLLGIKEQPVTDDNWQYALQNLSREKKYFHPNDLQLAYAEDRNDRQPINDGEEPFDFKRLIKENMLSEQGIVRLFYLYCELRGVDTTNVNDIVESGLKKFHYQYCFDLMEEFRKNPDIRFGDELLVACEKYEKEIADEEAKENI